MKKRFLTRAALALVLGTVAYFFLHRYLESKSELPALSEKELADGSRKLLGAPPNSEGDQVVPAQLISPSQNIRLAIGSLGFADDQENHKLADLVAAELSHAGGLELVERQSLDKILREQSLSVSGLVRAREAMRVGKLLRVDWFLLGSQIVAPDRKGLVVRMVDAHTGVMRDITVFEAVSDLLVTARNVSAFARQARSGASNSDAKTFLAVGQFADVGINSRQAEFPNHLRNYLLAAYQRSNVRLLEREYVDMMLQEVRLDLAGLSEQTNTPPPQGFQTAFWLVDGEFQSYESESYEVELALRINRIFGHSVKQTLRGQAGEKLFESVKTAIDTAIASKSGLVLAPTRQGEARQQMRDGKDLYSLATGGQQPGMARAGYRSLGFSIQEPAKRKRSLENAIRAFRTVLLLEPGNYEAKFYLAACFHEETIAQYDEARNLLKELAACNDYDWQRAGMLNLAASYEGYDNDESVKWLTLAAEKSKDSRDADYARQQAERVHGNAIAGAAQSQGSLPRGKDMALLEKQLLERLQDAQNVMQGKSGVMDWSYGLETFAKAMGNDQECRATNIVRMLPTLKSNFPALVPHLLSSAVTYQMDTNGPVYREFRESLDFFRAHPRDLLSRAHYFQNLLGHTYEWCIKNKYYDLAITLFEAKRQAAKTAPDLALDPKEKVKLAFAYSNSQQWSNSLSVLEELGDTPVIMENEHGPWGLGFTPFLPAKQAAICREKLGLVAISSSDTFDLGAPCVHLEAPAVLATSSDGAWLGIANRLIHLSLDLQTNFVVSLPSPSFASITALSCDRNRIWIGTQGDGLFEYDKEANKFRHFTQKDGLLLNQITALGLSRNLLWIGFGDESAGGLGQFDPVSAQITSFTPSLSVDAIPAQQFTGSSVSDPVTQAPRHPVTGIVPNPSGDIWMYVLGSELRQYRPHQKKWEGFPRWDATSVYSIAANAERTVAGLSVQKLEVEMEVVQAGTSTNAPPTKTFVVTRAEFDRLRADPISSKKIKQSYMGRLQPGALAVLDAQTEDWRLVGGDGSIPSGPQALALHGSDVLVGGYGYVGVFSLAENKMRKICLIAAQHVDTIQISGGYLWTQFEQHLYRIPLSQLD